MPAFSDSAKSIIERMRSRAEDPEFQARAEQLARENAEEAKRMAESDRRLRLQQGAVPMSTWEALREPKDTDAIKAVRGFFAGPAERSLLVLSGPKGRGKTFALAYAISERGGLFSDAQSLVFAGSFDPVWRDLSEASVAALDELGAEHRNDAFYASLYSLLNGRYSNLRRTVIATNLNAADFKARYPDDRLHERIRTGGLWVNLPGESMRAAHWSDKETDDGPGADRDAEGRGADGVPSLGP